MCIFMKMVIVKKVDTTYEVTEFLMNYVCKLIIYCTVLQMQTEKR